MADLLHHDIVAAAEKVIPAQRAAPDETEVAAAGPATAVGARNGRLLAGMSDLSALHTFSRRTRTQVHNIRGEMSLPHVRGARKVSYAQLWVEPRCIEQQTNGADILNRVDSRPMGLIGRPGSARPWT